MTNSRSDVLTGINVLEFKTNLKYVKEIWKSKVDCNLEKAVEP